MTMELQQSLLLPLKIETAIDRLREFCPEAGYHLAFSGGKDSQAIYELCLMAAVPFDAHFALTSVDPPEVIRFVRSEYPDVVLHRPEKSMFKLIAEKQMPPTRLVRYCCELLKEPHGHNRVVVTGIRWDESIKRRDRRMVETCIKDSTKRYLNPIIDWTTPEVWQFLLSRGLEYCILYDEGCKRIGCVLCPMAYYKRRLWEMERWPAIFRAYMRAFGKMLETRKKRSLKTDGWKSPKEVMEWWLELRAHPEETTRLFSMYE